MSKQKSKKVHRNSYFLKDNEPKVESTDQEDEFDLFGGQEQEEELESLNQEESKHFSTIDDPANETVETRIVTAGLLNVRKEPNQTSEVASVAKKGDRLLVVERVDQDWIKIESMTYDVVGFVMEKFTVKDVGNG